VHPADVALLVAASVEELRERLEAQPGLAVRAVELTDDVDLSIRFEIATSEGAPGLAGMAAGPAVPIIGTRRTEEFILHLDCGDWDSQPPTAELRDDQDTLLSNDRWPHDRRERGIVQGHPLYGDRKFFCRPGIREFHTHPQHEDQPWDAIREGMTLHGIVLGLLYDLTHRWTFR
jgi:hypothetical protein